MNLRKFCTVLLVFLCLAIMNISSLAQTFDEMEASVKEHVISNGMKFIVLERHEAPVVSFHVYADVGSVNDFAYRLYRRNQNPTVVGDMNMVLVEGGKSD